jgi:DNA-binding transcriptional LysR family regulator
MTPMDHDARSLGGVDLNLVKALDALLQEHSVTRAAERLSLTQPTVSAALAKLRVIFEDELLIKTGKVMRPTPFAETLAPQVRSTLTEVEALISSRADFSPHEDARTFRVLATDYAALVLIRPLMEVLARDAPKVRIFLDTGKILQHSERLDLGDIDVAVVPQWFTQSTGLPSEPLFTDRFIAAAWQMNMAVSDPMTLEELADLPYLGYDLGPLAPVVDSVLQQLGIAHQADTIVSSFVIGPLLIKGTKQITFVQERLFHLIAGLAELKALEPPCEFPPIVETVTWHPRSTNDPGHRWLREQMRQVASRLPATQVSTARGSVRWPPVSTRREGRSGAPRRPR